MEFEYHPTMSQSNLEKLGIDFETAQQLWRDPDLVEIAAKTTDGPRYLVAGKIEDKHWSAMVSYRGGSIRIISVRRSRQAEVAIYES